MNTDSLKERVVDKLCRRLQQEARKKERLIAEILDQHIGPGDAILNRVQRQQLEGFRSLCRQLWRLDDYGIFSLQAFKRSPLLLDQGFLDEVARDPEEWEGSAASSPC